MKLLLMNAFIPSSLSLAHSRPSSSPLKVLCLLSLAWWEGLLIVVSVSGLFRNGKNSLVNCYLSL